MPENINLNSLVRSAAVLPASVSEEARTVEVTFTTGAMVRRSDWYEGEYEEELVVSPEAMRMDRLNGGAPLLADHMAWNLECVHGVVERAWIDGGDGRALVRFARDEDSETIWQKVKDGIIRNISVGYFVHAYQEIKDGARRILRAVDWEPYEISLVAVGADAKAAVRSEQPAPSKPCVIHRAADVKTKGVKKMTKKTEAEKRSADDQEDEDMVTIARSEYEELKTKAAADEGESDERAAPGADATADQAAAPASGERSVEIMELCQLAGVPMARALEFVKGEKPIAEIRAALVAERASSGSTEISSQTKPPVTQQAAGTAERMASRFAATKK